MSDQAPSDIGGAWPFVLSVLLLVGSLVLLPGTASAGQAVIFSEDFEAGLSRWETDDFEAEFGKDFWGISTARRSEGAASVWCAQEGVNHNNGVPNPDNGYYDESTDAQMWIELSDISGYESVSLEFAYWALTGSFSRADYLSVWVFSVDTWVSLWEQSGVDSGGWKTVTLSVPRTTTTVLFRFISDPTLGLGPYEGVYVDDVSLVGTESVPPQSGLGGVAAYQNSRSFEVSYSASDNAGASGLHDVAIQVSQDGGAWTTLASVNFPANTFAASGQTSITLPSDGSFQLRTIATDNAGNAEASSKGAQASTIIDTGLPSLQLNGPLPGQVITTSNVAISWSGSDDLSGIDHYEVVLDEGPPADVGTAAASILTNVADGGHTVTVTAVDKAGNRASASASFQVDTNPLSPTGPFSIWPLVSLVFVAFAVVGLFLYLRRRSRTT